jgi:hypothetical protein
MPLAMLAFRVAMKGERPPLQTVSKDRCPQQLERLITGCWDNDPRRRPAVSDGAAQLLQCCGCHACATVACGCVVWPRLFIATFPGQRICGSRQRLCARAGCGGTQAALVRVPEAVQRKSRGELKCATVMLGCACEQMSKIGV